MDFQRGRRGTEIYEGSSVSAYYYLYIKLKIAKHCPPALPSLPMAKDRACTLWATIPKWHYRPSHGLLPCACRVLCDTTDPVRRVFPAVSPCPNRQPRRHHKKQREATLQLYPRLIRLLGTKRERKDVEAEWLLGGFFYAGDKIVSVVDATKEQYYNLSVDKRQLQRFVYL